MSAKGAAVIVGAAVLTIGGIAVAAKPSKPSSGNLTSPTPSTSTTTTTTATTTTAPTTTAPLPAPAPPIGTQANPYPIAPAYQGSGWYSTIGQSGGWQAIIQITSQSQWMGYVSEGAFGVGLITQVPGAAKIPSFTFWAYRTAASDPSWGAWPTFGVYQGWMGVGWYMFSSHPAWGRWFLGTAGDLSTLNNAVTKNIGSIPSPVVDY